MKKCIFIAGLALILGVGVYMGTLAADKNQLSEDILRLHVVGASNSQADQAVKLLVRDEVLAAAQQITAGAGDKAQAVQFLKENLSVLEDVANEVLAQQGLQDRAMVNLGVEEFPTRQYDTFTLPAGIYDTLRITIGEGQGKNWWCVVFPSLCIPAASQECKDVATGAGFSDGLSGAITGQPQYQVRFFLLDVWGRIENFFHKG